jgi:hypothetical protein
MIPIPTGHFGRRHNVHDFKRGWVSTPVRGVRPCERCAEMSHVSVTVSMQCAVCVIFIHIFLYTVRVAPVLRSSASIRGLLQRRGLLVSQSQIRGGARFPTQHTHHTHAAHTTGDGRTRAHDTRHALGQHRRTGEGEGERDVKKLSVSVRGEVLLLGCCTSQARPPTAHDGRTHAAPAPTTDDRRAPTTHALTTHTTHTHAHRPSAPLTHSHAHTRALKID